MGEENNKSQNKKQPKRFNPDQYDLLMKCSEKKDITEWNQYRKQNPKESIELEDANFLGWDINGANLDAAYMGGANLCGTNLEGANFSFAFLGGANFTEAYLERTDFHYADLEKANFTNADLARATFAHANMKQACFQEASLKRADFFITNLEEAQFDNAYLVEAEFYLCNLKGAKFNEAFIEGACFLRSIVSSETDFFSCDIDRKTNFQDVAIDNMRMDFGTRELLKYNIRRFNWGAWYRAHKILRWPVRLFWQVSDYGSSTLRIIAWFFGLAFGFAIIYRIWPGLVMVRGGVDYLRDFIHALYFSVVTMTTLGFGDIAANPDSHCGQILLMVQVISGYVLLGALITRLAVLFTGEGPAGKFSNEKK